MLISNSLFNSINSAGIASVIETTVYNGNLEIA
jgi:hypothetical protein